MKPAPATMPWDEQAGKLASFSSLPRTSLTLLTWQNASADCAFWGPAGAARRRLVCSPQSNGVQRSAITMLGCASMLPRVLDNRCGVRPTLPAFPASYFETTWGAPMQSARMRGEPGYDVEKFRRLCKRRVRDTVLQRNHSDR